MPTHRRLEETRAARLAKLRLVRQAGLDPYPATVGDHVAVSQALAAIDANQTKPLTVAGRIRSLRVHGQALFADLQDASGRIQLYLKADSLAAASYQHFVETIDVGDFLEVTGEPMRTQRGQPSLLAFTYRLLAKSTEPLPEKFHGVADSELRSRKRELDLLANDASRQRFLQRSVKVQSIRRQLEANGFLEVETPILQPIPGGATAEPFVTRHEALETDLYLRVAPELYLKRLVVGGFDRVYEIARCFRNESIDRDHNPEFTQVEFYAAYWDYQMMMEFVERLVRQAAVDTAGQGTVTFEKQTIDFAQPFARLDFRQSLIEAAGIDLDEYPDATSLRKLAKAKKVEVTASMGRGKVIDLLFKKFVRPNIVQPTFLIDHPLDLSPLAKKKADKPGYVERFQLLVAGSEVANAFSELNDPEDQHQRFLDQDKLRQAGDSEALRLDEDFIDALRIGLPPTAGVGIGLDRLAAILTNAANLKDVILFPALRPTTDRPQPTKKKAR